MSHRAFSILFGRLDTRDTPGVPVGDTSCNGLKLAKRQPLGIQPPRNHCILLLFIPCLIPVLYCVFQVIVPRRQTDSGLNETLILWRVQSLSDRLGPVLLRTPDLGGRSAPVAERSPLRVRIRPPKGKPCPPA